MASLDDIREAAEQDLVTFIRLVAPQRMMGAVMRNCVAGGIVRTLSLTSLPCYREIMANLL